MRAFLSAAHTPTCLPLARAYSAVVCDMYVLFCGRGRWQGTKRVFFWFGLKTYLPFVDVKTPRKDQCLAGRPAFAGAGKW